MLKRIIRPLVNFLLIFLSTFLSNTFAENLTDSQNEKTINIQADSAEFDESQGTATYRGHVIMEQGLTRVTSDTLYLVRDHKGRIKSILATGHPAYFTQNNDTISGDCLSYDLITHVLSSDPIPGKKTTILLSPKETNKDE